MPAINSLVMSLAALAALSELMHAVCENEEFAAGADMLCGLCCAGCILAGVEKVLGILM